VRATGMGAASAFGRIGGILVAADHRQRVRQPRLLRGVRADLRVLGVGVLAVLTLGVSTKGRTLEDITAETAGAAPSGSRASETRS